MSSDARRARRALGIGLCGALLLTAPSAQAQVVGYAASLSGGRGTYPTGQVDGVYVFNGIDVTIGRARVAFTVPWMRVETSSPDTSTTTPVAATTSTGFGDPVVRVDVNLVDDRTRSLQVGIAGAVKMPFVDASTGRATGEADVGIGGTAFATLQRTSLMADVLFWKYGDPEGVDFADTWSYSVGAAQVVGSGRWSAIATIAGFSAGIDGAPPPVTLNTGVLTLVGRRQSLAVTASIGLNESAADFFISTSWRVTN